MPGLAQKFVDRFKLNMLVNPEIRITDQLINSDMTNMLWVGCYGEISFVDAEVNKIIPALSVETLFVGMTLIDPTFDWETPSMLIYVYACPIKTESEISTGRNYVRGQIYTHPRPTRDTLNKF